MPTEVELSCLHEEIEAYLEAVAAVGRANEDRCRLRRCVVLSARLVAAAVLTAVLVVGFALLGASGGWLRLVVVVGVIELGPLLVLAGVLATDRCIDSLLTRRA